MAKNNEVPSKSPINIDRLKQVGFTNNDVIAMNNAIINSNFPWLYDNDKLIYKGRRIELIENIHDGNELGRSLDQPVRVSKNPKYSAIRSDIGGYGYSLTELPPAARLLRDDDGNEILVAIDGRTRMEILESLGVNTVIVDVFEIENDGDFHRISQKYNHWHKPFGEGSTADIENTIITLNKINELKFTWKGGLKAVYHKDNQVFRARLKEAGEVISNEAFNLSNHKLTEDQLSQITSNVINELQEGKNVLIRKFNNGGRIKKFIKETFNLIDDATTKYVPFSGSELATGKLLESIHTHKKNGFFDHESNRLFFIFYCGKPNPKDPEGSWAKATVRDMKKETDDILSYFNFSNKNQVSVYGAIPQIKSLDDKYPMDQIIRF